MATSSDLVPARRRIKLLVNGCGYDCVKVNTYLKYRYAIRGLKSESSVRK